MTQDAFSTLAELANAVERLCQEGRSGTLHIVTSDNHTAYFGLLGGQIVALRYRIRKDTRALEHILKVSSGRYTFTEGAQVETSAEALPSTAKILALLGAGASEAYAGDVPADPFLSTPTPDAPRNIPRRNIPRGSTETVARRGAAPATQHAHLSESTQAILLDVLTHYAGPAASLLGRGVFVSTDDVGEAIELLAQKIPNGAQAQAFVTEARRKLGHLL